MPRLTVLPSTKPASPPGLESALARAIRGEVRFSRHDRLLYATDASLYQVEPLGVVVPADVEDAVVAARVCLDRGVPVLPRGGGTSLAGQCTSRAVVIDFSPNCRGVLELDTPGRRVRVEPGITVDDLNGALEPTGLFFAPDPATSRHANVGGCIGNNAAGARSIVYGRTSENLLGVDVLLPDGARVRLDEGAARRDPRVLDLTRCVASVVVEHEALIDARYPRTIRRNAGYALDMVLADLRAGGAIDRVRALAPGEPIPPEALARVNLAHLVCGSEGTLAVTLGAELRLHERPARRGLAVVSFADLDAAVDAVVPILATGPSAVELLDDTILDLARANAEYARYVELVPRPGAGPARAVLYVEYSGSSPAEIADRFGVLRATISRACPGASLAEHTGARAMLDAWKLRQAGEPLLHGVAGARKPVTFVEDNAVPVENLARFVREFRAIVDRHGTRAAYYAHASVGVLHVRPLIDLHQPEDRARLRAIAVEVADLARSLGGVMSGEHGDGRVRTPLLERHYGPELMDAMRRVKAIFDPRGLLNPGNIVEARGIEGLTQDLRLSPGGRDARVPPVETYFDYSDAHGFEGAVEMCNGAGVCRKKRGGTMCPSYMATLDERHSTRGRGNALRLAITGQLGAGRPAWDDPETRRTLDLCLSCKACKSECPSNVDVARLKAEFLAQGYRDSPPPLSARVLGGVRTLNRLGSLVPGLANWSANLGVSRSIARRLLRIDRRRSLPRFEDPLPRRWSPPLGSRPRVVLFGDCFTMYNEPGVGLASRRVLEALGYDVVLAGVGCCGRAKISGGLLEPARGEIEESARALIDLERREDARAVLVAEPSCLSAIKDDWLGLRLSVSKDALQRLAGACLLPEQFVHERWDDHPVRPAFSPVGPIVLHAHCHQKALWGAATSADALGRIPGAGVRVLDSGCCGLAGAFGYDVDRFDLSMAIGELSLLPEARRLPEGTHLAATGTSCRHQILDGARRRARHPVELLAMALDPPQAPGAPGASSSTRTT